MKIHPQRKKTEKEKEKGGWGGGGYTANKQHISKQPCHSQLLSLRSRGSANSGGTKLFGNSETRTTFLKHRVENWSQAGGKTPPDTCKCFPISLIKVVCLTLIMLPLKMAAGEF